jgi:hypothetical protein
VAHFAEGFGFDLADALAGDLELAAVFASGIFGCFGVFSLKQDEAAVPRRNPVP